MSTPKNPLRSVAIFSTPLGPQGTASSSGLEWAYPGNWLPSPIFAQHWGVLVQDAEDSTGAGDTFFELYRPGNNIDVLRRSRAEREASETANPRSVYYEKTGFVTDWSDDEIEKCGKNVCKHHMNGTYVLLEANCQTMANLLAQRIAFGPDPMVPYQTITHKLIGGLAGRSLSAVNGFDQAQSKVLNSILFQQARKAKEVSSTSVPSEASAAPFEGVTGNIANESMREDELIDLDLGERPEGPLQVSEVRSNARFWSRDWDSPGPEFIKAPPVSLPEGYLEWAENKKNKNSSVPERFPGPDSPYIKWLKSSIEDSFTRNVKFQRDSKARAKEIELWDKPNISEETRSKTVAELAIKENEWLRKSRVAMMNYFMRPTISGSHSQIDDPNAEDSWDVEEDEPRFQLEQHSEEENLLPRTKVNRPS